MSRKKRIKIKGKPRIFKIKSDGMEYNISKIPSTKIEMKILVLFYFFIKQLMLKRVWFVSKMKVYFGSIFSKLKSF